MEHIGVVRDLLLVLIGVTAFHFTLPAPCGHPCAACQRERVDKAKRQLEDTHHMWHVRPVDGCPYCKGGKE